ncbi:Pre-mRNA-splicing factor Syf2 [Gracilaria domingensis]|nr:Pre-mRNA-splicing factor Syf2 [Gracilaria domingensis]
MASATERLKQLKEKLLEAREENLKAADYEERQQKEEHECIVDQEPQRKLQRNKTSSKERFKRRGNDGEYDAGAISADEADGDHNDAMLRSMKRRARAMEKILHNESREVQNEDDEIITYGAVSDSKEGVDRMVNEIECVERRRAKYRRRRTFDEDRADISFINEGNRIFNRTLDKHFDKFESVQKIKDSLERGTAQ